MENPCKNPSKWMGHKNEPLSGFSWRGGCDRDTLGILVWSDVFLHTDQDGNDLAIILMDTQGLFDNDSTFQENSRIFTLSTLITSMQVFNIQGKIQEDQLHYLQVR